MTDQARRTELASALADLVHQIDLGDYRDAKGHNLHNNLAFLQAQAIVDRYGLSHEDLCAAMDRHGLQPDRLAAALG